jgi:hypothetical protein
MHTEHKQNKVADVIRTPNPKCPACLAFRFHTDEEWKQFHPKAGRGTDRREAPQK